MAQAHKVLGQSSPSATTLTTLYTVPASTQAVCSSLTICNTASSATTYRVAIRPSGATVATQHYIDTFERPLPTSVPRTRRWVGKWPGKGKVITHPNESHRCSQYFTLVRIIHVNTPPQRNCHGNIE